MIRLRGVEAEFELAWSCLGALLDGLLGGLDQLAAGTCGGAPRRAGDRAQRRARRAVRRRPGGTRPPRRRRRGTADHGARRRHALGRRPHPAGAVVHRPPPAVRPGRDRVGAPRGDRRVARHRSGGRARRGPRRRRRPHPARCRSDAARSARRQLVAAGGGIPLVLVEAAHLLDADQREGRADLPDPMPIGPSGQRVVDLLLERLPSAARAALVVAAADPDGDLLRILTRPCASAGSR